MKKFILFISCLILVACLEDKNIAPSTTKVDTTTVTQLPVSNNTCDTLLISFEKSIWPIIQKNCVSCHSATSPSAGIDLSTYSKILPYVQNGKLYGSITHAAGYKPMPSSTTKLSNCDLTIIRKWLRGSAPSGNIMVDLNPANPVNPVVEVPVTKPPVTLNCSPDTVYFKQKILPLLVSNCAMSGCHDAISKKDGVILTDYTNIMREVRVSNPASSDLYRSLIATGGDRMPPAGPLSTENINNVLTWIKQGAKNNSCEASAANCVTTNVSYKSIIQPMLATNCTGCHSGARPSGGIDLTTHANVQKYAINGKLYGSIVHQTGYIPMPSATTKLSTCEIDQVKSWIVAGSLNN
ncbi:MAG: hypothetical protein RIQ98_167 [Bacteroidota bacterium]